MAIVTDIQYGLENRFIKKLDLMIERCTNKNLRKDAWLINEGGEGEGKCVLESSNILMANGEWKNVRDIRIGDVVMSPQEEGNNIFAKVTSINNGVCNDLYEVKQLNKVKKTLYYCSGNHKIPCNIKIKSRKKEKCIWTIQNIEAKDYSAFSDSKKKNSTMITSFKIDKFMDKPNCIIEPYTLGVYLGDGSFSYYSRGNRNIRQVNISHSNLDVMNEILSFYPAHKVNTTNRRGDTYSFSVNGDLAKQLLNIGLAGKGSGEKFIPKEALLSDANYRTRLLAGLMDTDGFYYHGGYTFTMKSKQLIEDIKNLVYSLGGRCGEIREVKKTIKSIGFTGTYYSLAIYLGDLDLPLKKGYKTKKDKSFYLSPNRISIDVVPSKPGRVYGITIDSPSHWMIVNDWNVTHNSNTSFAEAYYVKHQTNRPIHLFFRLEQLIDFAKKNKEAIIWWDEPSLDSLSADHMKEINKNLLRLAMTIRKKRHFFIINFTKFWKFPEYIIVDRALGMVHMYSRREVEPGRFVYIKKSRLEALWNGKKSSNQRLYRKLATIRGRMPNLYEKHFDKGHITIHGVKDVIPNATYDQYEEQKDKAIESIGEDDESNDKKNLDRLKLLLGTMILPIKNKVQLAKRLNVSRRSINDWYNLGSKSHLKALFEVRKAAIEENMNTIGLSTTEDDVKDRIEVENEPERPIKTMKVVKEPANKINDGPIDLSSGPISFQKN